MAIAVFVLLLHTHIRNLSMEFKKNDEQTAATGTAASNINGRIKNTTTENK